MGDDVGTERPRPGLRERGALLFGALIVLVAGLYRIRALPVAVSVWAAYVLTHPLGAPWATH